MTAATPTTRRRARQGLTGAERAELESYRAAFASITAVCAGAANGDLETRLPRHEGADATIDEARHVVNGLLDLIDAFVREASAAIEAAGEQRFHRAFLVRGMRGAFRDGADTVYRARQTMRESAERLATTDRHRTELAADFETAVLSASEQVATQTADASERIEREALDVQVAAEEAGRVLDEISETILSMHDGVHAIGIAVNGDQRPQGGLEDFSGLAQLATLLRTEVDSFLTELRT